MKMPENPILDPIPDYIGKYGYTSCPTVLDIETIKFAYGIAAVNPVELQGIDIPSAATGLLHHGHGSLLGAIHAILQERGAVASEAAMCVLLNLYFPSVLARYPDKIPSKGIDPVTLALVSGHAVFPFSGVKCGGYTRPIVQVPKR